MTARKFYNTGTGSWLPLVIKKMALSRLLVSLKLNPKISAYGPRNTGRAHQDTFYHCQAVSSSYWPILSFRTVLTKP